MKRVLDEAVAIAFSVVVYAPGLEDGRDARVLVLVWILLDRASGRLNELLSRFGRKIR